MLVCLSRCGSRLFRKHALSAFLAACCLVNPRYHLGTTIMVKYFPKILAWSALLTWFGFIYLFLQYDATRPIAPRPAEGRVYASNNHGHITYLTKQEEDQLHSLEIGALSLFMMAALIDHFQRNPEHIGQIRMIAARHLYDILDPAAWYRAAARAGQRLTPTSIRSVVRVFAPQKRISLHSEENISDCRSRLVGAVGFNTIGPVLGSIKGNKFRLYLIRKDFRNSFSPHFHGKLSVAPSGTIIEGKFKMHFIVKILLGIWFTGVAAIGGKLAVISVKSIANGRATGDTYVPLIYAMLLLLCGLLIVYWGKTLGTDDEAQILAFLQHRLNSRPSRNATA
jgi:hypothetical protein